MWVRHIRGFGFGIPLGGSQCHWDWKVVFRRPPLNMVAFGVYSCSRPPLELTRPAANTSLDLFDLPIINEFS